MPTLIRLLTAIAILVVVAYGAMFALVTFVEPNTTEMTTTVPDERFAEPQ